MASSAAVRTSRKLSQKLSPRYLAQYRRRTVPQSSLYIHHTESCHGTRQVKAVRVRRQDPALVASERQACGRVTHIYRSDEGIICGPQLALTWATRADPDVFVKVSLATSMTLRVPTLLYCADDQEVEQLGVYEKAGQCAVDGFVQSNDFDGALEEGRRAAVFLADECVLTGADYGISTVGDRFGDRSSLVTATR
ncbi:hypothetical protein KCV07_g183, partial [Aureobasidium melanogenum]